MMRFAEPVAKPLPKFSIVESNLECDNGNFKPKSLTVSDTYSCCLDDSDETTCSKAVVKTLCE